MRQRHFGQRSFVLWPAATAAGPLRVPIQLKIDGEVDFGEEGRQTWRFTLLNAAIEWDLAGRRTLNLELLAEELLDWLDPHVDPEDPETLSGC